MRLYVGNLSKQVTDAQLNDLAMPYGTVIAANVVLESSQGRSRGFGFVELSNPDEARAMLTALDGREVHGMALKVSEARPRKERQDAAPVQF
jgi:RNA recognition motif-containing protein